MRNLFRLAAIILTGSVLLISCKKENTPPVADFTIDPVTGNDETIFLFDATPTVDLEDDPEEVTVMWDWEGDGIFDTPYASRKTADHRYEQGEYAVTMVARDSRGLTDTARQSLSVLSSNLPPETPFGPNPTDQAEKIKKRINLSWQCTDPEGDYIVYAIWFGETNPPPLYKTGHFQTSIDPGELEYKKTYYWKIVAKDVEGNETEGPVWSFSTLNLTFGSLTDSRDNQSYETIQIGDQWWMAENLNFASENSYCYENNPSMCDTYGRLYSWEEALTACPDGWHLPTKEEMETLVLTLGGMDLAGGHLKDYESSTWFSPNTGANNESGFGALPAGRRYDHGLFTGRGYYAQFYSSTEHNSAEAFNLMLGYDYEIAFIYNYKKKYAISVRCIRD